jgi:hypothetical protein
MVSYKEPDNIAWRIANIIQIPIGLLFVAISLMYPESPVSKVNNAIVPINLFKNRGGSLKNTPIIHEGLWNSLHGSDQDL